MIMDKDINLTVMIVNHGGKYFSLFNKSLFLERKYVVN